MLEPVVAPIADVLAGLVSLYVQLLAALLSGAMVSGLLARRQRGARRLAYAVAALCALHLFLGLLLPFARDSLLLSPLFSLWAMLGSLALLVLALGLATAIGLTAGRSGAPPTRPIGRAGHLKLMLLNYALTIAIVFGGVSILTAQHQRNGLRADICAALDGKLDTAWQERAARLRALTERLLRKDAGALRFCD
ncbi:hypothetical protein [Acidimangrovimonas pyrenivorans]|uniref:Uncharacterized protein n=1 Tax=Acidimangrovimonas pyrenivorans TaxID=2030798 RepID=A0ABV7AGW0_9RHOB